MIHKRYWFWDKRTNLLNQVRTFVDYTDPSINRTSASLEIKDIESGIANNFTIETSDTGNYTWLEGDDFKIADDDTDRQVAEAIAAAVNDTANFTADAVTGNPGNCFVYIHYTASGYLTDAYSGDTNAWQFYSVNASNNTIRTIYETDSGAIKSQPFFSNRDGFIHFYVADGSGQFDIDPYKSGQPTEDIYYEQFTP